MAMDPGELERLRERSGLALDKDGRFLHEGTPVEHPRVVAMLHRGLGRAPDGRPTVRFGETWAYLQVEDTLYRAVQATLREAGGVLAGLVAHLDDGTDHPVPLDGRSVALSDDDVLCLRVKEGAEWARTSPGVHARIAAHLVDTPAGLALRTASGDVGVGRR
jgi:hypothetical protein